MFDMVAGVEKLTGRKVLAFLSANHIEPDFSGGKLRPRAPDPGWQGRRGLLSSTGATSQVPAR